MAETWQEFADPDLNAAEFGASWMSNQGEGRLPIVSENVTDEMLDWVEKYLELPSEVANACDVPLARLNLARRRVGSGDKAIDGSVCLEALLSGRSRGELTHRLSVRVALLLERSLDERQKIAEKVRKFYALRSEVGARKWKQEGSSQSPDSRGRTIGVPRRPQKGCDVWPGARARALGADGWAGLKPVLGT
jgi:hypothetical protein